jgi:Tryptophan dimethylallyltransferase
MLSPSSSNSLNGLDSGVHYCGPQRLVDYTAERLGSLCAAAGFGSEADDIVRTVADLMRPWGERPLGQPSAWISEISDDHTPVEFSVALSREDAEVRVLFEPQGAEPTLPAYRAAGLAFHERLEREFGADLRRFRLVQDLFLPENMQGRLAVWSSVVFSPGRAPSFKAYFNPQARGRAHAEALVEEALSRLGLAGAWSSLVKTPLRRGPRLDELKYFALDLTSAAHARVKIYVHHHDATPEDLEFACGAADGYLPGEALEFARAMRGGDGPMRERSPFTCSSFDGFAAKGDVRPASTTVYIPVCAYAHDDAAVRARVHDYLVAKDLGAPLYASIVDGFANRPLEAGVGMHSWVALRRSRAGVRVTLYFATEAQLIYSPGTVPAPTSDASCATAPAGEPGPTFTPVSEVRP